jgi:hypothetical protein
MINEIWKSGKQIDEKNISTIEFKWKIKFPLKFRDLILNHNQAYPENNAFKTNAGRERLVGELLNFDLQGKFNVLTRYESVSDILPGNCFPFAVDPGGNLICFDYSRNLVPEIIFWNHEGTVVNGREVYDVEYVADSFDKFLAILYKPE